MMRKRFFLNLLKLKPLVKSNWDNATKSFLDFQSSYALWKRMLHNHTSMAFLKKDGRAKSIIDSIEKEFKKILETIMVVNLFLIDNPTNQIVIDSNKGVFQIEVKEDEAASYVIYTPLARIKILPLLGELEEIAIGKKTMTEMECPSYSTIYKEY